MKARLPHDFSYRAASDLIRLGKDNDGGYLISRSDTAQSDVLIGLGINDDWSFEEDFTAIKDMSVYAYDASISQKRFIKHFVKSLIKINKPKRILHALNVILSYQRFFSKPNKHHIKKFVGLDTDCTTHCTLASVFEGINSQNIFLKIDVEGSEYRFLETLISNQNRISGLVLELHDCDVHLDKITDFIARFDLNLVHIHANNFAPIRLEDGLPLVIELSFSRHCNAFDVPSLPHPLDMPNKRKSDEIELVISELEAANRESA